MQLTRKLATAAMALSMAMAPVAGWAESLTDAMISAYRTSGLLDQQRALLRSADEDVAQSVASLRPVISYALSGSATRTDTPLASATSTSASAQLSASLLLYDFGASRAGIDIAKETVLSTRDALTGVEQGVLLNAVSAYLDMRYAQRALSLQSHSVRVLTQDLRAARDRFEVGEITQTDVSQAEAGLAAARAALASAEGDVAIARENYNFAIGHYPDGIENLPATPMIPGTLAAAQAQAAQRHPDILAARRAVTIAELGVEATEASMKPSLNATASTSHTLSDDVTSDGVTRTQIGVNLGGTLYAGGQLSSAYRQAKINAEYNRAALLQTQKSVTQSVANAWATLGVATASIEAGQRTIDAAQVALDGAREEANLGARTTLDVLDAEQTLLDAQVTLLQSQTSQYLAVYSLLSSMGLLTADHLNLGIATYDPEAYYNAVSSAPLYEVSPQGERLDSVLRALGRE